MSVIHHYIRHIKEARCGGRGVNSNLRAKEDNYTGVLKDEMRACL